MKLGFFTMPMHPPGRDYTQTLKEDREAVLLADRLGYCEAFIGEHITDVCETIVVTVVVPHSNGLAAPCSIAATTGPSRSSRGARWNSWRKRSCLPSTPRSVTSARAPPP